MCFTTSRAFLLNSEIYYKLWSPSHIFFKSVRCYMLQVGTSELAELSPYSGGTSFACGLQTGSKKLVGSVNPVLRIRPFLKR